MAARDPMTWLARRLGCTEGQAYTLAIAIPLTVAMIWAGVPPTLKDRVNAGTNLTARPIPAPQDAPDPLVGPDRTPLARSPLAPVTIPPAAVPADPAPATPQAAPATPRATIAPPRTAMALGPPRIAAVVGQPGAPDGVGTLPDGRLVVATNNGGTRGANAPSEVITFTAEGVRERTVTVEGQSGVRTSGLAGLVVDAAGNAFIADTAGARILRVSMTGSQATYADIPDVGACALLASAESCEDGARDDRPAPRGLALSPSGELLVADVGQAIVWQIDVTGKATVWRSMPESDPPVAVAGERSGAVLVLVSRSADPSRAGQGVLSRYRSATADAEVVTITEALADPSGMGVGPGGEIVVTVTGTNAILLLSPDGRQHHRLEATEVEGRTGVPLDGPASVTATDEAVYVTNGSPRSNTAENWVVFEIPFTR